jgi:hypothetical protein
LLLPSIIPIHTTATMAPAAFSAAGTLVVAALLVTSTDALRAAPADMTLASDPPPHDAGPPGAPPVPPHNGTVIVRHGRELGQFDGWSDGRCTWCVRVRHCMRRMTHLICLYCMHVCSHVHLKSSQRLLCLRLFARRYGGPGGPGPDGMNIFTGSCGYGKNLAAPYFIAAAQARTRTCTRLVCLLVFLFPFACRTHTQRAAC